MNDELRIGNVTLILYPFKETYIYHLIKPCHGASHGRALYINNEAEHRNFQDKIISKWMKTFRHGALAERLRSGLQNHLRGLESRTRLQESKNES